MIYEERPVLKARTRALAVSTVKYFLGIIILTLILPPIVFVLYLVPIGAVWGWFFTNFRFPFNLSFLGSLFSLHGGNGGKGGSGGSGGSSGNSGMS